MYIIIYNLYVFMYLLLLRDKWDAQVSIYFLSLREKEKEE